MIKKKYKIRLNRKYRKKYKRKIRGRGFVGGFKLLYSLGSQWCKSMRWGEKKLCNGKTKYAKKSDFTKW